MTQTHQCARLGCDHPATWLMQIAIGWAVIDVVRVCQQHHDEAEGEYRRIGRCDALLTEDQWAWVAQAFKAERKPMPERAKAVLRFARL